MGLRTPRPCIDRKLLRFHRVWITWQPEKGTRLAVAPFSAHAAIGGRQGFGELSANLARAAVPRIGLPCRGRQVWPPETKAVLPLGRCLSAFKASTYAWLMPQCALAAQLLPTPLLLAAHWTVALLLPFFVPRRRARRLCCCWMWGPACIRTWRTALARWLAC